VAGPALNGTDLDFLKVTARAGVLPYWCGITIHPYIRGGPENYAAVYRQVRQVIRTSTKSDQQIDVMCGESGYSTSWAGTDEATQGRYLARLFLFDVATGVPLTIWYDWRDDGTDLKNQEHNFGIVRHEYHVGAANVYDPKPAYLAAANFSRQLTGCRFEKRLRTASDLDYVLIFTTPNSECLVAWTAASKPHAIDFAAPDGNYQVIGYDGSQKPAAHSIAGTIHLTLDGGPQYLKLLR
jgi:hypothetical protein